MQYLTQSYKTLDAQDQRVQQLKSTKLIEDKYLQMIEIPSTQGLARIAGTVNPTMNRKTIHDGKFQAKEESTHATTSKNKQTKNDGLRPQ